jgi:hypothetical protein
VKKRKSDPYVKIIHYSLADTAQKIRVVENEKRYVKSFSRREIYNRIR